jgi:hypothetical protein
LVRRNVHWRLLLLLDAHHHLFQRSVVRDSVHSEDLLYAPAYTDSNANGYTNRDGYAHSDSNSAANIYADSATVADGNSYPHSDGNPYGYGDTNSYRDGNSDGYSHGDCHTNINSYLNAYSNSDRYANWDAYSYAYRHSERDSYADPDMYAARQLHALDDRVGSYSDRSVAGQRVPAAARQSYLRQRSMLGHSGIPRIP